MGVFLAGRWNCASRGSEIVSATCYTSVASESMIEDIEIGEDRDNVSYARAIAAVKW